MEFAALRFNFLVICLLLSLSLFRNYVAASNSSNDTDCETTEGHIQVTVSQNGIDFVKDVLVSKAKEELRSLQIDDFEKTFKSSIFGTGKFKMTDFRIIGIEAPSTSVALGNSSINVVASHIEVNCSMNWKYSYKKWFITVTDKGEADIQIKEMEVGITLQLDEKNGSLCLSTLECGTYLKELTITLSGGASWLYQNFINAFEENIKAAVETAMTTNLVESITKLNSTLQGIPKIVKIQDSVAMNFTVMQAPAIGPKSISIGVEGLFVHLNSSALLMPAYNFKSSSSALLMPAYNFKPIVSCSVPSTMLEVILSEDVLRSGAKVYTEAGMLKWIVDKIPEQSLLNTGTWKLIIPELYKKYPNDDMKVEISVPSPPNISITKDGVHAIVVSDLVIDVLDGNATIQVACITMTISTNVIIDVSGNNIIGYAEMSDLSLQLKWSDVGNFHMRLIQIIVRTLVKDAVFPLVNIQLKNGFPLPIIDNFGVKDAVIEYGESQILVSMNVEYIAQNKFLSEVIAGF
eukprot:TRINITY_DN2372_c0_g1_i1.p1 TRINITY_DN2372_c0_g1~~TRINITY_DN2372_c0_g1_i1.p1  ORF type:complete len:519 (+),score=72.97 TRINITY_DN2372_c0_g1_i1:170-1726(+)